MPVQILSADLKDVASKLTNLHAQSKGPGAVDNAAERGAEIGIIYSANRDRIIPSVMNAGTNTIDAGLKRVAIMQESVRAFAKRILPLRMFATSFGNVPLAGTDEVTVGYYPLQAGASKDFVQANGYVFDGASNTGVRKITVNKRKYQGLDYSSAELNRQPFFDTVRLGQMNAEKLAVDVITDILSIVTAAKFGLAVKSIAEAAWTSDDVVDVAGACGDAMWPEGARGLIVNSNIDLALQKDSAYKLAMNIGTNSVITEGRFPKLSGFEYAYIPGLPANAEDLTGFAVYMSAILAAFAPVNPAPGVRRNLVAYEVVTEPTSGISFNYRHWGDPDADEDREVIECAYGFEAGEAAALKRFTK